MMLSSTTSINNTVGRHRHIRGRWLIVPRNLLEGTLGRLHLVSSTMLKLGDVGSLLT